MGEGSHVYKLEALTTETKRFRPLKFWLPEEMSSFKLENGS